jgi:hypothetical protein
MVSLAVLAAWVVAAPADDQNRGPAPAPAPIPASGPATDRKTPPPPPAPPADPTAKVKATDDVRTRSILDGLIYNRGAKAAGPQAGGNAETAKVVDGLLEAEKKRIAENQREGLLAYQQALAAANANRPVEALRLAKKAKSLFPNNPDIAAYAAVMQMEVNANRQLTSSNVRAKAYLAAGVSRGQELMRVGKYNEGEDLLLGVLDAARLFPEPASVDLYRRMAEQELDQYHMAVQSGTANPEPAPGVAAVDQAKWAAPGSTPPDNLRRLLRSADGRAPLWYANQKTKLTTPMSVDYKRASVASILDEIAEKTGLTFVIDTPVALSRAHINALLDLRVSDVPAETVLDLACQKAGVEYVPMERSIVITTRPKAIEYVRQWPEGLRHNWALGRVLFPEVHPELFAAVPAVGAISPIPATPLRVREADLNVPLHLRSGKALVAAIQALLK